MPWHPGKARPADKQHLPTPPRLSNCHLRSRSPTIRDLNPAPPQTPILSHVLRETDNSEILSNHLFSALLRSAPPSLTTGGIDTLASSFSLSSFFSKSRLPWKWFRAFPSFFSGHELVPDSQLLPLKFPLAVLIAIREPASLFLSIFFLSISGTV